MNPESNGYVPEEELMRMPNNNTTETKEPSTNIGVGAKELPEITDDSQSLDEQGQDQDIISPNENPKAQVSEIDKLNSKEQENNTEFQKAKELYELGCRVYGWGNILTDNDDYISLYKNKKEIGYWADGSGRNTDKAFGLLGLSKETNGTEAEQNKILNYLCDISEKEKIQKNDYNTSRLIEDSINSRY